jgi:hypothetical protein
MRMKIDHYMVDYLNDAGNVSFANDTHITDLTKAKSLAAKTSKTVADGAYVVAYVAPSDRGNFVAVGHISFFDGKQSDTDGTVI